MAAKETFSCILKAISVGESEKEWESDDVRYVCGKRFKYAVSGDFIVTMISVVNGKSELSTGNGVAFGNSRVRIPASLKYNEGASQTFGLLIINGVVAIEKRKW